MVFWKRELRELEASGHRFEDIFRIFSTEFTDTPFSLQFTAGQTQRMSYAELTALTNRLARVLPCALCRAGGRVSGDPHGKFSPVGRGVFWHADGRAFGLCC